MPPKCEKHNQYYYSDRPCSGCASERVAREALVAQREEWKSDPVAFLEEVLGISLRDRQVAKIRAVSSVS